VRTPPSWQGAGEARLRCLSLFCRHNRYVAECPICSKGTVLDSGRPGATRRRTPARPPSRSGRTAPHGAATVRGPYGAAGPYAANGAEYEVRLERVPGGVRLAQWSGGRLQRRAPELPVGDLARLVVAAVERELLPARDAEALAGAIQAEPSAPAEPDGVGASPGRAGDLREELRVERREGDFVRVARWLLYPSRGWELQDAPPMLPAARYAEALRAIALG
jgi:hypothetical protein